MLVKLATGDWVDATQVEAVTFGLASASGRDKVTVVMRSGTQNESLYPNGEDVESLSDEVAGQINAELERLNEGVCPECWSNEREDATAAGMLDMSTSSGPQFIPEVRTAEVKNERPVHSFGYLNAEPQSRPPVAEAADFVVTDDGEAALGRGRE